MGKSVARGLVLLVLFASAGACDAIEREQQPRYYIAPDASSGDTPDATSPSPAGPPPDGGPASDGGDAGPAEPDPSSLTLTGWWRASYAGSPWVGVGSAGGSAGRTLEEATNAPAVGPAARTFTPAAFDGTNDRLLATLPTTTFISPGAWEVHALFSADAAPARPALPYNAPALVGDSQGYFYMTFTSAGVGAGHYDAATYKEIVAPCPTGNLHAVQAWFDGTNLHLAIDGAAPVPPVAAGPLAAPAPTGALRVGANWDASAVLNGRIYELLTAAQVLGEPARAHVRRYWNRRYGTAFP